MVDVVPIERASHWQLYPPSACQAIYGQIPTLCSSFRENHGAIMDLMSSDEIGILTLF